MDIGEPVKKISLAMVLLGIVAGCSSSKDNDPSFQEMLDSNVNMSISGNFREDRKQYIRIWQDTSNKYGIFAGALSKCNDVNTRFVKESLAGGIEFGGLNQNDIQNIENAYKSGFRNGKTLNCDRGTEATVTGDFNYAGDRPSRYYCKMLWEYGSIHGLDRSSRDNIRKNRDYTTHLDNCGLPMGS